MSLAQNAHNPTGELVERWRAIQERVTRGRQTYDAGGVVHLEGNEWAVRSGTHGGFYRVDLADETCECPDYEHRAGPLGITCKHVYACAIAHASRRASGRGGCDELYAAACEAMRLLQDRQQHTPEEMIDPRERRVLRQLRAAVRGAS